MRICLVVIDVRSAHNVGALLRSADGFGAEAVYLTGITPYPSMPNDQRLPHIRQSVTNKLHKTALGAEASGNIHYQPDFTELLNTLSAGGWYLAAIEQASYSQLLNTMPKDKPIAIIVGNELDGLPDLLLNRADGVYELPMHGQKESLNVAIAGSIALYELTRR